MPLLELAGMQLPGALPLPDSEAEILAALDGEGYLLMPYNGLPIILAVSSNKVSAGACERITETRLEVMQKSLREAGFKPGESVDLSQLAQLQAEALKDDSEADNEPEAEHDEDEDSDPIDDDPYSDEEEDPEDAEDELPFQTEAEKQEKLRAASAAMKAHSRAIVTAELDAVYPAVLAWGIAGRGWGLPGRGEKPTAQHLAGDDFLGRALRSALLDGFLRPIMRGLPTQAAFHPEHLFPREKPTELLSNPQA